MDFATYFATGSSYSDYLANHASPGDLRSWTRTYESIELSANQLKTLRGFERKMHVLCVTGTWCPDCSAQCPILQRIAESCEQIDLRYMDRDEFISSGGEMKLCGGHRVPTVIFLSEDDYFCGVYGDRSLTRYRQLAGYPHNPTDGLSAQQMICQEWLNEFERIQLMLVTSPRLQSAAGR